MKKLKYAIPFLAGIFIGMAVEKVLGFRNAFANEVWSLRDNLALEINLMQELVEDCDKISYEIVSEANEVETEYFGKKIESITTFPHLGSERNQKIFEEYHQNFIKARNLMSEQIEKCPGN